MCNRPEKDCGEKPNFRPVWEQDEPVPSEEIKKMLKSMRDLYFAGKYNEAARASIIFLSGLYTGLNLKEKRKL